jgi:hypothetical protein
MPTVLQTVKPTAPQGLTLSGAASRDRIGISHPSIADAHRRSSDIPSAPVGKSASSLISLAHRLGPTARSHAHAPVTRVPTTVPCNAALPQTSAPARQRAWRLPRGGLLPRLPISRGRRVIRVVEPAGELVQLGRFVGTASNRAAIRQLIRSTNVTATGSRSSKSRDIAARRTRPPPAPKLDSLARIAPPGRAMIPAPWRYRQNVRRV